MKTRILYITPAGERGGAEVVLLNILRHLDRSRFEPAVIVLRDGPFVRELAERAKVAVDVLPTKRFRNLSHAWHVIRQLQHVIRTRQIHLVHCCGTGAHLYGGLAARVCGVPSIYHLKDIVEWSWSRQGLVHLLAFLVPATTTIAVSHYVARRFHESWRSRRTVNVIHNGVDVSNNDSLKNSNNLCRELGWFEGCFLSVWCGRLQRWKGTHVFLKAAAIARQRVPNARFLVVGGSLFGLDTGYEGELRALAKALDLDGYVRFTGHQADVRSFMKAADVIVHSSIRPEPFGLVILEGMFLGKTVIASNEGGPVEIVQHGVTGLLVPPNDPAALADALVRLLGDKALREKMGQAGRDRAEQCFTVSQMMQKIESLYQDLASR